MSELSATGVSRMGRVWTILSTVAVGRVEIACTCEPGLFVDGLYFCDQAIAHWHVHAG